jgi:hypothetical protein
MHITADKRTPVAMFRVTGFQKKIAARPCTLSLAQLKRVLGLSAWLIQSESDPQFQDPFPIARCFMGVYGPIHWQR